MAFFAVAENLDHNFFGLKLMLSTNLLLDFPQGLLSKLNNLSAF